MGHAGVLRIHGFRDACRDAASVCAAQCNPIEDRVTVEQALADCAAGIDLADALHHACYRNCMSIATFDDRKFARRAKRLGLMPTIFVPT
jgi:hypothetical protein